MIWIVVGLMAIIVFLVVCVKAGAYMDDWEDGNE